MASAPYLTNYPLILLIIYVHVFVLPFRVPLRDSGFWAGKCWIIISETREGKGGFGKKNFRSLLCGYDFIQLHTSVSNPSASSQKVLTEDGGSYKNLKI